MTTPRKKKVPTRRKDAPAEAMRLDVFPGADFVTYRIARVRDGRSVCIATEDGAIGRRVAAAWHEQRPATNPDDLELSLLDPLIPDLELAARLKPSLLQETIARGAYTAAFAVLWAARLDRLLAARHGAVKRSTSDAGRARHAAVVEALERARLHFMGTPTLQRMKVEAAAAELASLFGPKAETIRKKLTAWRRTLRG